MWKTVYGFDSQRLRPIWIQLAIKGQRGKNKHFLYDFSFRMSLSWSYWLKTVSWISVNGRCSKCTHTYVFVWVSVITRVNLNVYRSWLMWRVQVMFIFCWNYPERWTRVRWRWDEQLDQHTKQKCTKEKEVKNTNEKETDKGKGCGKKAGKKLFFVYLSEVKAKNLKGDRLLLNFLFCFFLETT